MIREIQPVQKILTETVVETHNPVGVIPLEQRLINGLANQISQTEQTRTAINAMMSKEGLSPDNLIKVQGILADYNIYVSLLSTYARKGAGAVETLLRS